MPVTWVACFLTASNKHGSGTLVNIERVVNLGNDACPFERWRNRQPHT